MLAARMTRKRDWPEPPALASMIGSHPFGLFIGIFKMGYPRSEVPRAPKRLCSAREVGFLRCGLRNRKERANELLQPTVRGRGQ
jgi:hypothetical protein